MRKVRGYFLISLPFVALFIYFVIQSSLFETSEIFLLAAIISGSFLSVVKLISTGIWLITEPPSSTKAQS